MKTLTTLTVIAGLLALAPAATARESARITVREARYADRHSLASDARDVVVNDCARVTVHKMRCRLSADMPELFIAVSASSDSIGGDVSAGPDYARSSYTVFSTLHRSGRITLWSPFWGWLPGVRLVHHGRM